MTAGNPAVLVMAKAPVPGRAKTRLGARVGHHVAAELAAASILDTLDVCESAFPGAGRRHLALAGDLDAAVRRDELAARLRTWTVHRQRVGGLSQRLARAHEDVSCAAGTSVVQIGTDTPHLSAGDLGDVADRLGEDNDAVLGPAEDGGWWVLALTHHRFARCLHDVEMSTVRTYADTLASLRRSGARVASAAGLHDVDTVEDALRAAAAAPGTRFARRWSTVTYGAVS